MARPRRRVKGAASVRRVLRALPDAARAEILDVMEAGSVDLHRLIVANTPRRTGDLRAGIKRRVLKQTMRMQVGLIGTKKGRAKLFYGRILDLGRKAQSVRVNRKGARTYVMRVRRIAPKRFVSGRYPDVRKIMNARLKGIWDRVLRTAATGGSDD